jgi:hypothetical protein
MSMDFMHYPDCLDTAGSHIVPTMHGSNSEGRCRMFALLSPHLVRKLEDERSPVLPRDSEPGVWFDHEGDGTSTGRRLRRLEDLWGAWDTVLFVAESRGERVEEHGIVQANQTQLVARIERWCEDSFRRFAIQYVRETLETNARVFAGEISADPRPLRAVEAAQRFLDQEIKDTELEEARDAARDAYKAINVTVENVFTARRETLMRAKAKDMALAATLLTTRDAPDQEIGTMMRRAVHAAFSSHCRTPGAPIAAKIHGRQREAEFLAFLGLGTEEEREEIHDGTGRSGMVYPVAVAGLEVIDPHEVSSE